MECCGGCEEGQHLTKEDRTKGLRKLMLDGWSVARGPQLGRRQEQSQRRMSHAANSYSQRMATAQCPSVVFTQNFIHRGTPRSKVTLMCSRGEVTGSTHWAYCILNLYFIIFFS